MKTLSLSVGALLVSGVTSFAQAVPDFHLYDVNPHSRRDDGLVSPRDYLLQVSGYYFGAAG